MLVGEQPGDVEDRSGRPFVGPAGRLLRELLEEAGLDTHDLYVTNAVLFQRRASGKRRIHDKPNWSEVRACNPWVRLELEAVRPEVVVCLGATGAQALHGRTHGWALSVGGCTRSRVWAGSSVTIHPSAILRSRDGREEMRAALLHDLERARDAALAPI